MRITFYELCKLFTKKALVSMLILLSLLNFWLLWNQKSEEFFSDQSLVKVYGDISEFGTNAEKLAYIEEKRFEFSVYENMYWTQMFDSPRELDLTDERVSAYVEKYASGDYSAYEGDVFLEHALYKAVYNEIYRAADYNGFIEDMEAAAETMKNSPLLAKPGTFAYENIIRTPPAYAHLKGITATVDISAGVARATENRVGDIVAVLIVLIAAFTLFLDEKDSGAFTLIRPTRNGFAGLLCGKITALFLWCFFVAVIMFAGGLALMSVKYGLGDLARQIQSVNIFIGSVLDVSVFGYFCLYVGAKTLSYFIIALFVAAVCVLAKNSAAVYLAVGVVGAVQVLLYILVSPLSEFGIFKFVNICALTQPNEIFKNYFNINFFGKPLNIITVSMFTAVILSAALVTALFLLSKKQMLTQFNNNFMSDFLSKFSRSTVHVNIFRHEMYKTFMYNKGLFALLLLAAIQVYSFYNYQASFAYQDDLFFKNYIERAGGFVTDETYTFIEAEQARFDEIEKSLSLARSKYDSGEITDSDYTLIQSNLQQMLMPRKAFGMFKERVAYIENVNDGQVVYEKGWNDIFGVENYGEDMKMSLFILIFLSIIIAPVYSAEKENGMVGILNTAPKGLTWMARYSVNLIAAIAVVALANLPFLINTLSYYDTGGS
ncbi:MAG: hypothetical protein LBI36_00330, partial [Oscillospiraceae bacterium]|nr:hypothetical protein [Oscillospiraceae bacterium]